MHKPRLNRSFTMNICERRRSSCHYDKLLRSSSINNKHHQKGEEGYEIFPPKTQPRRIYMNYSNKVCILILINFSLSQHLKY